MRVAFDTHILAYAGAVLGWADSFEVADSTWRGVTVVNPFAEPRAPLLTGLLRTSN